MITFLRSTDAGLQKMDEPAEGCWVNVVDPTPDEISQLCQQYDIPHDVMVYPLDMDEQARTETSSGATLIGLRIPAVEGKMAAIPYRTAPLGIVLTERIVITVHKTDISLLTEFAAGHIPGFSTSKKNRFALYLLLASAHKFLFYLREINREVDSLEDRLKKSLRNQEVLELLKYQKCLTLFMTALKSNELMIGRLQKHHIFLKYEEDQDLLDDVLTEFGQAIEMTTIASGILSQMMDAFASIISNNLNVVMKFLASITIILALPTLVASIYGMNIRLPLQDFEHAVVVIMGLTLLVTFVVVIIFLRRGWL